MSSVKVSVRGKSVIIEFVGVITIEIPTGCKTDIRNPWVDEHGIVRFEVNGEEDCLSIRDTVFGEPPRYQPFIYSIVKDLRGIGVKGLHKYLKKFFMKNKAKRAGDAKGKEFVDKSAAYREVFWITGDSFCARTDDNGEIYSKRCLMRKSNIQHISELI